MTIVADEAVRWAGVTLGALRRNQLGEDDVLVLGARGLADEVAHACAAHTVQFVTALVTSGMDDAAVATAARALFEERGRSGRCDVAVPLDGDVARAAALVRRGGTVLVPPSARRQPAMKTVVQREITLLPLGPEL